MNNLFIGMPPGVKKTAGDWGPYWEKIRHPVSGVIIKSKCLICEKELANSGYRAREQHRYVYF